MTDETQHPNVDQLAAYVAGTLDDDVADGVAEHLVACPECSEVVLDLDALSGPAGALDDGSAGLDDIGNLDDLAHERAWRDVRGELHGEPPEADAAPKAPTTALPHARRQTVPWHALAAVLAVAVVGLGLWSASLHEANETLRARLDGAEAGAGGVRPDLPVVYLDLVRSDATVVRLETGQDYLLLLVDPTADAEAYRATLRSSDSGTDSDIEPLWSGALRRSEDGGLRLGLPAPPSGTYRLRVEGATDGWSELVTYRLRIEREPADGRSAAGGG